MKSLLIAIVSVLPAALLAGCDNDSRMNAYANDLKVSTPLELDPTDEYEVVGWWSNGKEMLRFRDDGGYILHGTSNRYRLPLERGTWRQTSHAFLLLNPYGPQQRPEMHMPVTREAGRITFHLRDFAPMTRIERPPHAPEDDIFGAWASSDAEVRFERTGRYVFTPDPRAASADPSLVGHRGQWRLDDAGELTLRPDSPTMSEARVRVQASNEGITLDWDGRLLQRPDVAAAEKR